MAYRSLRLSFLVCCCFVGVGCLAQETIPAVRAESLAGNVVTLPDAGSGAPSLLIVGFSQKATDPAREWVKRARAVAPEPQLTVYTLPILAAAPKFVRGMILRSMRKDTPAVVQPRFVPLYDHEEEWKRATHFDKPDEVYVLLIDGQGRVRWRTEGAVGEASVEEMLRQVKAMGGQ